MKTKYREMHKNKIKIKIKTCLEPRYTQDIRFTKVILVLKDLHTSKASHFLNFLEQACPFFYF